MKAVAYEIVGASVECSRWMCLKPIREGGKTQDKVRLGELKALVHIFELKGRGDVMRRFRCETRQYHSCRFYDTRGMYGFRKRVLLFLY